MTEGLCQCGCGQLTTIAPWADAHKGYIKGQPRRFVKGHDKRRRTYTVDSSTGCWVWNHGRDTYGYGQLWDGPGRKVLAHRHFYEREVGPIPAGLELDHLCTNRACVNPTHLEPVTHAENMRRCGERRRNGKPNDNGGPK